MNKKPVIKACFFVDLAGSRGMTPEEEAEEQAGWFEEEYGCKLNYHMAMNMSQIQPGTDLLMFDYGGMMMGNSLAEDNSRRVIAWAEDHPNALVIVISSFTYDNCFRYEIRDTLNLDDLPPLSYNISEDKPGQTPIHNIVVSGGKGNVIPEWFCDKHGIKSGHSAFVGTLAEPDEAELTKPLLPFQKFFEPSEKFIKTMVKKFPKADIFDVGAGSGHVSAALAKTKKFKKVLALDLFERDGEQEHPIYKCDATIFPYPKNSVIMLCRPCHGSFPESVIQQAIDRNVKAVVYVGLNRNLENDLGVFRERFSRIAKNVGREGENIWEFVLNKKGRRS